MVHTKSPILLPFCLSMQIYFHIPVSQYSIPYSSRDVFQKINFLSLQSYHNSHSDSFYPHLSNNFPFPLSLNSFLYFQYDFENITIYSISHTKYNINSLFKLSFNIYILYTGEVTDHEYTIN